MSIFHTAKEFESTDTITDSIRIYTKCPACHNDTLTINNGRLLCTWCACPDPTLIDRLGEQGATRRTATGQT
jgi:hypothetical protein